MKDMKTDDAVVQDPGCCPALAKEPCCDVLDFRYRLPHRVSVSDAGQKAAVTVEVILHLRLTRCPGRRSSPHHHIVPRGKGEDVHQRSAVSLHARQLDQS